MHRPIDTGIQISNSLSPPESTKRGFISTQNQYKDLVCDYLRAPPNLILIHVA